MLPWEYDLFRKGAGCPCCEGVGPDDPSEAESIHLDAMRQQVIEPTDDDRVGDNLMAIGLGEKRPAWQRPEDPVLWTCDGCGIRVIQNLDTEELEYEEHGKCKQWYHSHPLSWRHDPPEQPPCTLTDGFRVCEYCHVSCYDCNADISSMVNGDSSDHAYLKSDDYRGDKPRCYDCETNTCTECDESPEECVCCVVCLQPDWSCDCQDCETCDTKTAARELLEDPDNPDWYYCRECGVPEAETTGGAA